MAIISKNGVAIELTTIISYYFKEDEIQDVDDIGIYEAFNLTYKVNGEDVASSIIGGPTFELCSGNILSFIQMLEDGVRLGEYQEVEFLEPNFSFELKPLKGEETTYYLYAWINSGNWKSSYGATDMGFRLPLERSEVENFIVQLKDDWAKRQKQIYR